MSVVLPPLPAATPPHQDNSSADTFTVAQDLEAAFLAQMLTIAGVGETPGTFGGGSGETQFSSFLVQEYAQAMSKAGGIGLSEHIFNAMIAAKGGDPDVT